MELQRGSRSPFRFGVLVVTLPAYACAAVVGADWDRPRSELAQDAASQGAPTAPSEGGSVDALAPTPVLPKPDGTCEAGACDACRPACTDGFVCDKGACVPSCTLEMFYEDHDLDGWGAGPSIRACIAPPGFVRKTGDCHDSNPNVFPHQQAYFAAAYTTTTGESSFDYDCDGSESPDPAAGDIRACAEGEACDKVHTGDRCWAGIPSRPSNCGRARAFCNHPFGWADVGSLACR